jgi:hypothetical protein
VITGKVGLIEHPLCLDGRSGFELSIYGCRVKFCRQYRLVRCSNRHPHSSRRFICSSRATTTFTVSCRFLHASVECRVVVCHCGAPQTDSWSISDCTNDEEKCELCCMHGCCKSNWIRKWPLSCFIHVCWSLKSQYLLYLTLVYRPDHTVYLCGLWGSENKQLLFPYTALTGWFL